jgi:hypothetical protein
MSKKVFLDAFYDQFHSFLQQLMLVFPEDRDIFLFESGLKLVQKTNPTLVVREVVAKMTPFEKAIETKDEKFLLDFQYTSIEELQGMDMVINKLKEMWKTISDENKECIWKYLQVILGLAKRYSALQ